MYDCPKYNVRKRKVENFKKDSKFPARSMKINSSACQDQLHRRPCLVTRCNYNSLNSRQFHFMQTRPTAVRVFPLVFY